jgi:hypothetical protein
MKPRIRQSAVVAGLALLFGVLLSAPAWAAVSFDDVLRMTNAGVSEETILKLVDSEGAGYALGVDEIIALKEAGASESFIQDLLQAEQGAPPADEQPQYNSSDVYGTNDNSDYSTVFSYHYYDPFAYYWYAWPDYYVYYSPFWWANAGFYYGGFWSWDWWSPFNASSLFCDDHFGFSHRFGHSRTWDRDRDDRHWREPSGDFDHDRMTRERTMWHQAGLTNPPGRIEARAAYRQPAPTQRYDRPAYRTGTRDRGRQYAPPSSVGRDQSRTARSSGDRTTWRQAPPSQQRSPQYAPDRSRGGYSPEARTESGRSEGGRENGSGRTGSRPGRGR